MHPMESKNCHRTNFTNKLDIVVNNFKENNTRIIIAKKYRKILKILNI